MASVIGLHTTRYLGEKRRREASGRNEEEEAEAEDRTTSLTRALSLLNNQTQTLIKKSFNKGFRLQYFNHDKFLSLHRKCCDRDKERERERERLARALSTKTNKQGTATATATPKACRGPVPPPSLPRPLLPILITAKQGAEEGEKTSTGNKWQISFLFLFAVSSHEGH